MVVTRFCPRRTSAVSPSATEKGVMAMDCALAITFGRSTNQAPKAPAAAIATPTAMARRRLPDITAAAPAAAAPPVVVAAPTAEAATAPAVEALRIVAAVSPLPGVSTASSTAIISSALCGRSLASLANARMIISASASGTSLRRCLSGTGACEKCAAITCDGVPEKGGAPLSISYATTPIA